MDHYKRLGLDRSASKEEIKQAFRKLAMQHHPDRHSNSTKAVRDSSTRRFKLVNEAYEVLVDDRKRADYNSTTTKNKKSPRTTTNNNNRTAGTTTNNSNRTNTNNDYSNRTDNNNNDYRNRTTTNNDYTTNANNDYSNHTNNNHYSNKEPTLGVGMDIWIWVQ